jgi:hypothetical protein
MSPVCMCCPQNAAGVRRRRVHLQSLSCMLGKGYRVNHPNQLQDGCGFHIDRHELQSQMTEANAGLLAGANGTEHAGDVAFRDLFSVIIMKWLLCGWACFDAGNKGGQGLVRRHLP